MLKARIGIASLLVAAGVAIAVQQHDWTRMPRADDAAAAAQTVAGAFVEGDVVRAYPWWYDDSRVNLGTLPVLMGRDLDPWDLPLYQRVWMLVPDSHAAQAEDLAPWLEGVELIERVGTIEVRRGQVRQADRVAWDAFRAFDSAVVRRISRDGTSERDCSVRRGGEIHCGRIDPWIYAFAATREVDDTYRDCIQLNVAPDGERWSLRWDAVPRTSTLRMRAGNTLLATRSERGSPVQTRLLLDDVEVHQQETPILDNTYPETVIAVPPGAETMTVEVQVAADDHLDRFFCFRVQAYEPGASTHRATEPTR